MNLLKRLFSVVICCLFIVVQLHSQSDVNQVVDKYLKSTAAKSSESENLKIIFASNSLDVFYAINRFTSDSSLEVRTNAYRLLGMVGLKAGKSEDRMRYAKQLVFGCKDNDSGIVGIAFNYLTDFLISDFDNEAKHELTVLLNSNISYYQELVKLIGYINLTECVPEMKRILSEKKYPNNTVRWALHLALARMGDSVEVTYCINKIKNASLTDKLVYEIFPDLAYIRNKRAFDYLLSVIESDKKDCSSSNPDSDAKIICGYRVIQMVAPYIEKFPLELDGAGDVKWGNSKAALLKVREWIKTNRDSYKLITSKY